jgi:hypothetical protein
VGYGGNKYEDRRKLATFHPHGMISIHNNRHGATTNERLMSLLGMDFRTHQYETWVRCDFTDNGVAKRGYLPLRGDDTPANFVRSSQDYGAFTYINYIYPVVHKLNRVALSEFWHSVDEFARYLNGLYKLASGRLEFDRDTQLEAFGTIPNPYNTEQIISAPIPNLQWGDERDANRAKLMQWITSGDHMDYLRAAIVLERHTNYGKNPLDTLREYAMRSDPSRFLLPETHREGKLVTDRYKRMFL